MTVTEERDRKYKKIQALIRDTLKGFEEKGLSMDEVENVAKCFLPETNNYLARQQKTTKFTTVERGH